MSNTNQMIYVNYNDMEIRKLFSQIYRTLRKRWKRKYVTIRASLNDNNNNNGNNNKRQCSHNVNVLIMSMFS